MARNEHSVSISSFRGLNQRKLLGQNPSETTNLQNVIVRNGVVIGRKGINEHDDITAVATTTPIIGLAAYYRASTQAASLIRMTPTKVEIWDDGNNIWSDITGTDLTGTSAKRPQFATIDDTLVFTNEGSDRPRKYTGSGNTAVLGGTPPFCKAIESYVGFLFLGNTSAAGTTFLPLQIQYSDDHDVDWTLCDGNTLTIDETPGDIRVLKTQNRLLNVYKSDAIVAVRWTGGQTRFVQEKIFDKGIFAPLSLGVCGEFGQIFLGSDLNLYRNSNGNVQMLPPKLQVALQETMSITKAHLACAAVDEDQTTYHLFVSTSTDDTWLRGRLSYNYQTGEFYKGRYAGHQIIRAVAYKQSETVKNKIIVSASDHLVYETETGTDDNGTAVSRIYDTDYHSYGVPGDKYLTRVRLRFKGLQRDCHVRVSCAKNFEKDLPNEADSLEYPRTYDLRSNGEIEYNIPSPLYGNWFNIRVEMFHLGSTNVCELKEIVPYFVPLTRTSMETSKAEAPTTGQGV